jgi:hypothetical protein
MALTLVGPLDIDGASGTSAAYDIATTGVVVNKTETILHKIVCQVAGSIGLNDAISGPVITNQILPVTAFAAGEVLDLDWPCATGVYATVSGSGVFAISYT